MRTIILAAVSPLLLGVGPVLACPFHQAASRPLILADNAATSTVTPPAGDAAKKPDTTAFPNSPNGSPAAADKGAPVVTDKAACSGAGATACPDSPNASTAADTSDVKVATPTTVDGSAPKP